MKIIQMKDDTGGNLCPATDARCVNFDGIYISDLINSKSDNIYVSTDGDDSNDGSSSYPVKTISKAIEMIAYCSHEQINIILKSGRHSLHSTLDVNFPDKKIYIIGEDGAEINGLNQLDFKLNSTTGLYEADCAVQPNDIFVDGTKG